ncbi:hypothetical protein Selin_1044 [Desulfurispirillum indicum S5]|uniref:Outer membrane protein beta-barrel domain-containing protein n=1 Tax=Desulfurispirillum indicum (strain ATCC BAA-1389 / DSM 22839 / S5) TaxID=653733 RepID=E6W3I6_DESIS|nr:outer membrane beta-barrel protein [Desulfurispirillum indicum]ADU65779.1 hypothetical protein Selin_1044 [Desulfurispirillum indicum S5]
MGRCFLRKFIRAFLVIGSVAMAANASHLSEGTKYGGLSYTMMDYDLDGVSESYSPAALTGRLGIFVKEGIAVEGRLALEISDDSHSYDASWGEAKVTLGLKSLIGAYVIGHVPLENVGSIYGVLGFTKLETSVRYQEYDNSWGYYSESASESDSGLSYGFGFDWKVRSDVALNIEYMLYVNESDYSMSALNMGIKFYF